MLNKSKTNGFTLIEIVIVVAIVGVLFAIAFPQYEKYVRNSKRADAMAGLMNASNAMERFKAANMTYVGADANLPFVPNVPADGGTPYYTIAVSNLSRTTYTLTATPVNSMAGKDTPLTINHAGQKTWDGKTCWPEGGNSC